MKNDANSALAEIEKLVAGCGDEAYSTQEICEMWGLGEDATRKRIRIALKHGMVEVVVTPKKQINGIVIPRRCYRFLSGKKKKK